MAELDGKVAGITADAKVIGERMVRSRCCSFGSDARRLHSGAEPLIPRAGLTGADGRLALHAPCDSDGQASMRPRDCLDPWASLDHALAPLP